MHWNSNERLKEIEKIPNMIKRQQKEEINKKKTRTKLHEISKLCELYVCVCMHLYAYKHSRTL